jgi:hypothetical protein
LDRIQLCKRTFGRLLVANVVKVSLVGLHLLTMPPVFYRIFCSEGASAGLLRWNGILIRVVFAYGPLRVGLRSGAPTPVAFRQRRCAWRGVRRGAVRYRLVRPVRRRQLRGDAKTRVAPGHVWRGSGNRLESLFRGELLLAFARARRSEVPLRLRLPAIAVVQVAKLNDQMGAPETLVSVRRAPLLVRCESVCSS